MTRKNYCTVIIAITIAMVVATGNAGPNGAKMRSLHEVLGVQGTAQHKSARADRPFLSETGGAANPKVYGKTYGEWGAAWWQWALSFPVGESPIQDETGEFCDKGQSGPVWFLAGSEGVSGVERACTIPAGKAIFYPIIASTWTDCPFSGDEDLSDEEVRWIMAAFAQGGDNACVLTSTLDTFEVFGADEPAAISALQRPAVRSQSPVFTWNVPDEGAAVDFGCDVPFPPGETGRAIAEGYWVMLPPLSVGEHVLNLRGAANCGTEFFFETEVTYHLTVVPGQGRGN